MRAFAVLMEQHKEMMRFSFRIRQTFDDGAGGLDPNEMTQAMSKLSGILIPHLAMEDGALYPFLLRHEHDGIRALTKKIVGEMGPVWDLKAALYCHRKRWAAASSIKENPLEFVSVTRCLLGALEARIDKEENEIYALVTRLR